MKETIPILLVAPSPWCAVDDFAVDNENSPGPQETHVRRIYELLSNMGVHVPVEALSEESECLEKIV